MKLVLLLGLICCAVAFVESARGLGGIGDMMEPDGRIKNIVKRIKTDLERIIGRYLNNIEAEHYKISGVAGTIYYIKASVVEKMDEEYFMDVKVLHSFDDRLEILALNPDSEFSAPVESVNDPMYNVKRKPWNHSRLSKVRLADSRTKQLVKRVLIRVAMSLKRNILKITPISYQFRKAIGTTFYIRTRIHWNSTDNLLADLELHQMDPDSLVALNAIHLDVSERESREHLPTDVCRHDGVILFRNQISRRFAANEETEELMSRVFLTVQLNLQTPMRKLEPMTYSVLYGDDHILFVRALVTWTNGKKSFMDLKLFWRLDDRIEVRANYKQIDHTTPPEHCIPFGED